MTRPMVLVSRAIASTCASRLSNTSLVSALNLSGRFNVRVAAPPLLSRRTRLLIARFLLTIPPSAAERLEQARGIGVTIGLSLHPRQFSLLVGLLCIEHGHHADRPQRALALRKLKRFLGRLLRFGGCLERVGVRLQGAQRIGHILACQNDGGAI